MDAPLPSPALDYARALTVTDLYQLNMVEAYLAQGMTGRAVFEVFVRKLPASRGYLMAAGLEQAVRFALEARLAPEERDWLASTGRFSTATLDYLEGFRFEGDIDAVPEGTVLFADEPLIRIDAPLPAAQLLETRLLNFLQYQTLVATKAARMAQAAEGRLLVDFGLRRAHGGEAGVLAARAAYLTGFAGSATVPAGRLFGVPLMGTMAHSYVQAFEDETAAFLAFARTHPDQTVFLLDTYDIARAAGRVAEIAPTLAAEGIGVRGVRLDSGDMAAQARHVRATLDGAGLGEAKILASGGLDEFAVAALVASGAPLDGFGIGTALVVSDDLPSLDIAYKLKSYAGVPKRKRSESKAYWPGATQVWRRMSEGRIAGDLLSAADEAGPAQAAALLRPVVRDGALVAPLPDLEAVRAEAAANVAALPGPARRLEGAEPVAVTVSERLHRLAAEVDRRS